MNWKQVFEWLSFGESGTQHTQQAGGQQGYRMRSEEPDPVLVDAIEQGTSEQFEALKDSAKDLLDQDDVTGFWLQAIGDGSPLSNSNRAPFEKVSPRIEDRSDDTGTNQSEN